MLSLTTPVSTLANSDSPYKLNFANVEGQQVSLSEYKGKVVLLNFWATWCPPCIEEMPSMQRLREQLDGKPFEIVAVNVGEDSAAVSSFLMELSSDLTFPILLDEEGKSFGELGLRALPTTILFDQNGEVVTKVLGARDWDSAESVQEIESVINKDSASAL
ncbi:TlpA disulfide reductase family protein [Neptuniibacter sp.]|uniref:TlpA family protein disulfide reductase n=1 Tax=Neptuniibacter sp. TaxID=1962643 RepID=UPI00262B28E9|nr:TlpA disulfide reductase family protein [Neptuniibacter sp.]MCP4598868.1 TlpA family protein disulfide reductase [Neptuniibacter sp.]